MTSPPLSFAQGGLHRRRTSHQPDLNYDNPRVVETVLGVVRFWLELGVDGCALAPCPTSSNAKGRVMILDHFDYARIDGRNQVTLIKQYIA
jgi:hypothetical protein